MPNFSIDRKRLAGMAASLGLAAAAASAWAQAPAMDHGSMPGMNHGAAPAPAMDHGSMPGMDHGAPSAPAMDHGSMPGMDHGAAPAPAPAIGALPSSDGAGDQSYAAYGIHSHMMDDMVTSQLLFDKLGMTYDRDRRTGLQWDGQFWVGRDLDKLWIKSEGERVGGRSDGKVEAFWNRTISPFWDLQVGARRDFGTGPKRNWGAIGLQGVAPYNIETEVTAYVGGSGRTALALKAEYDLLLTQRLVLTPEIEASVYGKDDKARGIGAGLSDASFSLRLRYEITREVAPYVGVSFGRKFGKTASYASEEGESRSERAIMAGVRIWF
ncbi:copper resistance protein B CopB [Bordetella bronchiseptica E014]|nr:copper resistance protein B [Bordetella bronchiseptica]KAK51869.1 copper resistance protein B CopB [Bordetella bronchiseptica OSU054]KAK70328.1 copper resistance protein B CopB [Bordetella bronchiseptica CA90 BB02]KDB74778.1 copper resistance protein B CopB [Bordetella bronchiseptica CA90 BB1334]KDC19500.1 copper resistance protein B CopB [Bordetella bronchiseptica F-1]KDC20515.1 copper resistance protein B CopB [Bordetella bronchiseptica E014]